MIDEAKTLQQIIKDASRLPIADQHVILMIARAMVFSNYLWCGQDGHPSEPKQILH